MPVTKPTLYEGMFLLNQQAAASDLAGCVDFLNGIFTRAKAEVLALSKWDERRLAYPIERQKRGTFMIAHFHAPGDQIAQIERDCNLSDQVMRVMITRADHFGEEELELAKKNALALGAEIQQRQEQAASSPDAIAVQVSPQADNAPPPAAKTPEAPDTPKTPDTPDTPDTPEAPEAPEASAPKTSDTPETSDTPT